jgi:hypothetical protein
MLEMTDIWTHTDIKSIRAVVWGIDLASNSNEHTPEDDAVFRDLFELQCSIVKAEGFDVRQWSLHSVLDLAAIIRTNVAREEAVSILERRLEPRGDSNDAARQRFVDFVAGLILMCNTRLPHGTLRSSSRSSLQWKNCGLRECAADYFCQGRVLSESHRTRFSRDFDAWALEKNAGISVQLTDNLIDHLRLADNDTKVLVFHYASYLGAQLHP